MMALPPDRQIIHGRTHSRAWDAAESGAAIVRTPRRMRAPRDVWAEIETGPAVQRFRRRARMIDRLCWVTSFVIFFVTGLLLFKIV